MDMNFYEKLLGYYKGKIENDERYSKRVQNEERDAYRVIKAINKGKQHLAIKNIGDLAKLINVSQQLTINENTDIFEKFILLPQVEKIVNDLATKRPEEFKAIQDYDFSDWTQDETPLEQEHKMIEEFRRSNDENNYKAILSKVQNIIDANQKVVINSDAKSEEELSEKNKALIAISKMIMRNNGLLPDSQLQFENGKVIISYSDADKEFGDPSRAVAQTMDLTPEQIEKKKRQEEENRKKRDRWNPEEIRKRAKNIQQESKQQNTQKQGRGMSR